MWQGGKKPNKTSSAVASTQSIVLVVQRSQITDDITHCGMWSLSASYVNCKLTVFGMSVASFVCKNDWHNVLWHVMKCQEGHDTLWHFMMFMTCIDIKMMDVSWHVMKWLCHFVTFHDVLWHFIMFCCFLRSFMMWKWRTCHDIHHEMSWNHKLFERHGMKCPSWTFQYCKNSY